MKKITINVKQFSPHVQFALCELGLTNYKVMVYFASLSMARKMKLIPYTATSPRFHGAYVGNGIIWINNKVLNQRKFSVMTADIIFHELRHYYQDVKKMFPFSPEETALIARFVKIKRETKALRQQREQLPREVDAIKFADKMHHKMLGSELKYSYRHYDYTFV